MKTQSYNIGAFQSKLELIFMSSSSDSKIIKHKKIPTIMVKVHFKNNKLIRTFKHVDKVSNDHLSLLSKRMAFIILVSICRNNHCVSFH